MDLDLDTGPGTQLLPILYLRSLSVRSYYPYYWGPSFYGGAFFGGPRVFIGRRWR